MIRITFELLPRGREELKRTIGIMEVANIGVHPDGTGDYAVMMTKTPPFSGALNAAWKKGRVSYTDSVLSTVMPGEDDELITALVTGHHRSRRGVYDLLYRALKACGLDRRNADA